MKKLIICLFFLPFSLRAGFDNLQVPGNFHVREGTWPILLERTIGIMDTTYFLTFRDEQVLTSVVMDTVPFPNLKQLRFFQQALTALRAGHNGDEAKFKGYSIKRADVKRESTWYILRHDQWGLTNFQQPEADLMINAIKTY